MTHCSNCNHPIDDPLARNCTNCGTELGVGAEAASDVVVSAGGPSPPSGPGVPFEDTSLPFFQRFIDTVKLAFSDPVRLFSNMPEEGQIGPPVIFGILVGSVGVAIGLIWQVMFSGSIAMLGGGAEEFAVSTGLMLLFALISPAFILVGIFISAGVYHLMLMLLGGANRGFGITLRAICYGYTPNLLAIIPICGGAIGGIWSLVLAIIGATYGHKTDGWRATLAYFLPMFLFCCLAMMLFSMLGTLGALAEQ